MEQRGMEARTHWDFRKSMPMHTIHVVSAYGLSVLQNTFNTRSVHIVLFVFCEINE